MHRAEAGAQLSPKWHTYATLACRLKEGFPGGQQIVFRARRPHRFDSERTKSSMSLKTENKVMHATLPVPRSAEVAYVCHFGAFQDQQPLSRAPHRPSKNAIFFEVEKRVWSRRLERNAYFQSAATCQ